MDSSLIGWIITGLIGLFLVAGTLIGLIRGMKKSLVFLIVSIVILAVGVFVAPLITDAILYWQLPAGINLQANGGRAASLNDWLTGMLQNVSAVKSLLEGHPELITFIAKLPAMLANSIIFILFYWAARIVLWPIVGIMCMIFIKKKDKDGEKKSKHRLAGCGIGLVSGLIVAGFTLMPLLGLNNMLVRAENVQLYTDTTQTTTEGLLSNLFGLAGEETVSEIKEYVFVYEDSIGAKLLRYTGMEFLSLSSFNYLSTITVEDTKISLKEETDNIFKLYQSVNFLITTDYANITKQKMSAVIDKTDDVIDAIFTLKTVNLIGDAVWDYVMGGLASGDGLVDVPSTGKGEIDDVVDDGLNALSEEEFSQVKDELKAIVNLTRVLNNYDLMVPIIKGEISMDSAVTLMSAAGFAEDVSQALANIEIINKITPTILNSLMSFAFDMLDADFDKNEDMADLNVKNVYEKIITLAVKVMDADFNDTQAIISDAVMVPLGEFLDFVRDEILTGTSYKNLIDALALKIEEHTESASGSADEVGDILASAVKNLYIKKNAQGGYEASCKDEFTIYARNLNKIIDLMEDGNFDSLESLTEGENSILSVLGEILDDFKENSKTFDSVIISRFYGYLIDTATEGMNGGSENEYEDIFNVIANSKNNANKVVSWQSELTKLGEFFKTFTTITEDSEGSSLFDQFQNGGLSEELGDAFNLLDETQLFAGAPKDILSSFIDIINDKWDETIDDGQSVEDIGVMRDVFAQMKTNLSNMDNLDTVSEVGDKHYYKVNWQPGTGEEDCLTKWAFELSCFDKLIALGTLDSLSFGEIGRTLDEIRLSVVIGQEGVNILVEYAIDLAIGDPSVTFAGAPQYIIDLVTTIISNLKAGNVESYEASLQALEDAKTNMQSLNSFDPSSFFGNGVSGASNPEENIEAIEEMLNSMVGSGLITEEDLIDIVVGEDSGIIDGVMTEIIGDGNSEITQDELDDIIEDVTGGSNITNIDQLIDILKGFNGLTQQP